jgi:acyl-CoA oxidase
MNTITQVLDPTASALASALRGRRLSSFETKLVEVLHDDIFKRVEGLRPSEACALSYRRLRHLHRRMELKIDDLLSDLDKLFALHEWVGIVDGTLMTVLTIHYNLCIGSILEHGGQRSDLHSVLAELDRLDSVGVFLATELAYGNNVQAMETEAVYDHATREFVIHTPRPEAQKFMPNTGADGVAKLAVVMARLKVQGRDCGVFPFVVRIRTEAGVCEGVRVVPLGEKPDYALDNAITIFDHVRIPFEYWLSGRESLIDDFGRFSSTVASRGQRFMNAMERVQSGKLCISHGSLTVLKGSLDLTLRYATQRKTFGLGLRAVPILNYHTYQNFAFQGVAVAYACSFILQHARSQYQQRRHGSVALNRLLAVCKVFVSYHAIEVMRLCRERIGAQGMFSANRVISYLIQANGVVTAEGDNEILLVKIAREMLVGQEYEAPAAMEREGSLESADDLIALTRECERRMLARLRPSLASAEQKSMFEAWNSHLGEAVGLAKIHVQRLGLEAFQAGVATVENPEAREVLELLLRLFALQEVERLSMPLLIEGVLRPELARRIAPERARIVAQLSPFSSRFIAAFDIPETLVDAPIASNYVEAYDEVTEERASRPGSYVRELRPLVGFPGQRLLEVAQGSQRT